jgi:HlyD family secretion protein/epimerase transport system membrane fusion protein
VSLIALHPAEAPAHRSTLKADALFSARPFSAQLIAGAVLVVVGFVTFAAIWLTSAPVSSAVIAPGIVSVDTHRKLIQHLEGGIIEEIRAKNGDHVLPGQVLIKLRDVAAATEVARLRAQYAEALALAAQAAAERDGATKISFPEELRVLPAGSAVEAVMATQTQVFHSRRELVEHSLSVLRQKILQSEEQVVGLDGQLTAVREQLRLFELEITDAETLYKSQLLRKSKLLSLHRERAQLQGKASELRAQIASTREKILEFQLKSTELRGTRITQAVEAYRSQSNRAYELSRSLQAGEDVLRRTEIRSPIEGTVVNLQVHTTDGVIRPGQTVMEIVPTRDELVVEARILPAQREEVKAGLDAFVQLTAMNPRERQPISGVLESVSADRLLDQRTGTPFYLVRVLLDRASIKAQGAELVPGMGADVFIQTGRRTPLQYLADPILRTLDRGLREK